MHRGWLALVAAGALTSLLAAVLGRRAPAEPDARRRAA
jgi:hypothetical protein